MTTKHLKKWAPGESGNPAGRPAGAKNRLQGDFLHALAEDFREHGVEAIRIMWIERPAEYVKVVASLMPNELLHSDSDGGPVRFQRIERVIVQVPERLASDSGALTQSRRSPNASDPHKENELDNE
jgi:Family of unknown function (DUF5681)